MPLFPVPPTRPGLLRVCAAVLCLGLSTVSLVGCSHDASDDSGASESSTPTDGAGSPSAAHHEVLSVEKPWVKATDSGMTGVFGTLRNTGEDPVTLTGAQAPEAATSAELHVTVTDPATGATSMQKRKDPLVVEPGHAVELKPGEDHIMLMGLTCAPQPGADLTLVLKTDQGDQEVTVPVRDYTGAKEEYAPEEHSSASSTDHGEHHGKDAHEGMDGAPGGHGASPSATSLSECHAG